MEEYTGDEEVNRWRNTGAVRRIYRWRNIL